jgi:hypothetical protein
MIVKKFRRRGKAQLVLSNWSDRMDEMPTAVKGRQEREEELEAMLREAMPDERMPKLEPFQLCGAGEEESKPKREWL